MVLVEAPRPRLALAAAVHGAGAGGRRGVPPASCARANTPFFVRPDGEAFCTSDVANVARKIARYAGMGDVTVGGKAFRIGGAEDLYEALGVGGERLLRERGRWSSRDIGFIYARASAAMHLDGSARMSGATGRELEALCAGWVQPASFR